MLTAIDNERKLIIVYYPSEDDYEHSDLVNGITGDTMDSLIEKQIEEINSLFESVEEYQLKFTKELTDHPEYFAKLVQTLVDETYCMFNQVDWS